jgi:hypothetical protein
MRHKLEVVILAAVLTIAGTREAFRQFGELKSAATDWTRTSILGNLLVFAGGTTESPVAPSQTILLAETYHDCKGERSRPAAQAGRPASQPKAASAEHAKTSGSQSENSPDQRGLGALAQNLDAARQHGSREQLIVKLIPQVSEIAKTLGTEFDGREATETTVRARTLGEAGATHTRIAMELKKLGLRRVYVRVAKIESVPQVTPQDASLPVTSFDLNSFFYASHVSLGCDSELLN